MGMTSVRGWYKMVERWLSDYALIVSIVLLIFVAVFSSGCKEKMICNMGAILAVSFAYLQWSTDRGVKRAELLRELISRFSGFHVEAIIHNEENEYDGETERMCSLLTFMSYVCQLRRSNVLSEHEFASLKWDFVKILEGGKVCKFIKDAYAQSSRVEDRPYHDLLVELHGNCKTSFRLEYQRLLECCGSEAEGVEIPPVDTVKKIDFVGSEKRYANHLEVLNGIFNLGYRGHMQGAAMLPNGDAVWFPKYSTGKTPAVGQDKWSNFLSADGLELSEYLAENKVRNKVYYREGMKRYVFGRKMDGRAQQYQFLGVFEVEKEEESKVCVFKRTKDSLALEDVRNATSEVE